MCSTPAPRWKTARSSPAAAASCASQRSAIRSGSRSAALTKPPSRSSLPASRCATTSDTAPSAPRRPCCSAYCERASGQSKPKRPQSKGSNRATLPDSRLRRRNLRTARPCSEMNVEAIKSYYLELQSRIVAALEQLDGLAFRRDGWERSEGGGGSSCLIEEGHLFERGGVNFSHVAGTRLPPSASAGRPEL